MNTRHLTLIIAAAALTAASCTKTEGGQPAAEVTVAFTGELPQEGPSFIAPGNEASFGFTAANAEDIKVSEMPSGWTAALNIQDSTVTVSASEEAASTATLTLTAVSASGEEAACELGFYLLTNFDDPRGTFVLNEGNMTTENGSLTYITPEGYVVDDAYKAVNGTELGNVAQDMAFYGGKIYVICQNGNVNETGVEFENDGKLIIMDAHTLRKVQSFSSDELSMFDWPTHIAVLGENDIYIRDNAGIHRFNPQTKESVMLEGSDGAPKSRFVVMDGKAYTYKVAMKMGKILEIAPGSDAVTSTSLPYVLDVDVNEILGLQAAGDGKVWFMSFGFGEAAMNKFEIATRSIVQRKISVQPQVGSSGVAFVADGNKIYYADGTAIYRLDFDENPELAPETGLEAEQCLIDLSSLDDNAGMMYNGMGIHPQSGYVYINTIKGFAQFDNNRIWAFDFEADAKTPVATYDGYTNFPAGFYFCPEQ